MKDNGMMELNEEMMNQVVGGRDCTVNTGTGDKAAVRKGPGKAYGQLASLVNGTTVNTIGEPVWDSVSGRHFVEIEFYDKKGVLRTGWIASSLVGMKR